MEPNCSLHASATHSMVPDCDTTYEQNQHILHWGITTNSHNLWKMSIITHISHGAKFDMN